MPCVEAKAKQKNLPKGAKHKKHKKPNGQVFLDIATMKAKEGVPQAPRPHWRIIVNKKTFLKFLHFYEKKNDMVEPTCKMFSCWKQARRPVEYLQMDNTGKNKELVKRMTSTDWQLNIKPAFTVAKTLQ